MQYIDYICGEISVSPFFMLKLGYMNKIRPIILAVFVIAAAFLAYGLFTLPDFAELDVKDSISRLNYMIPGLGICNFSRTIYIVINVAVFLVFLVLFALEGVRGRIRISKVFVNSAKVLGLALGALLIGVLTTYICSLVSDVPFRPFTIMPGGTIDGVAAIVSVTLMVAVCVTVYLLQRIKAVRASAGSMRASASLNAAKSYAFNVLYGSSVVVFFVSIALLIAFGENMMLLIPLALAALAMILYHLTSLKEWLLAAVVLILLHAFSFYYLLSKIVTVGWLGVVMVLLSLVVMVLIPMADIYLTPSKKKQ